MVEQGLQRIGIDTHGLQKINWTKWILLLSVLLLAAGIGFYGIRNVAFNRTGLELGLLGIFLVTAIGMVLYRLELGVIAIVITSFFVRFTIPTGTATKIPASLIVSAAVVLIWILSMFLRRQVKLAPGYYVLPTLLFIVIAILSIPYSWLLLRPDLFGNGRSGQSGTDFTFVQIAAVVLMVLLPLVMLMTANVLRDEKWFKILFGLMIVVAIPELLQRITGNRMAIYDFKLSTGASYSVWVVALSFGQAMFNRALRVWQRGILLLIVGLWLFFGAEVNSTWFSGWMPAAVAVMFISLLRSRKLFFVFVLGGLFLFALRPEYYIGYIWKDAVTMDSNRFGIWQTIIFDLTLTKANIFFGAGPASYIKFYETYYPNADVILSHNNYVDIFAELGLVGFGIFMWMLFGMFRTGWEQRKQMPSEFLNGFNYGVLGGFVGICFAMGLGDWFIPFVYNIGVAGFDFAAYGWLLCGAMLALNFMQKPKQVTNATQ